jgi:hypothetical protein
MEFLDVASVFANMGFPAILSFYLLIRLEKSFERLEQAIKSLIEEKKKE